MVAQPIESTTISPAVNALRRYFLEHGRVLPVEHAEYIHCKVMASVLIENQRDRPDWRFDRDLGLAPGSADERAYRKWAGAWYERAAFERHIARAEGKDGRARVQAWLDAGCPMARY